MKDTSSSKVGDFRNLWVLFVPLAGTAFADYISSLLENLFLGKVSNQAMESAINATYACQIFQAASIALVMMAQVSVARLSGGNQDRSIGPGIWQYIWASLISMLFTVPASLFYGNWFFKGTEIAGSVLPYFHLLTWFNFLYPLGATLTCFFLGRGKVRFILVANLIDQTFKILLTYILIFGLEPWIKPVGFLGGLIANLTTQALFCCALFAIFIRKKTAISFDSRNWKLNPTLFWSSIRPGIFRALNQGLNAAGWSLIAHLMLSKGGDFLLILSLGGSLTLFLPFLFEAIYQSQTTVVSQILGADKQQPLLKAARPALLLSFGCIAIGAIPFIVFPTFTIKLLFPEITLNPESIRNMLFGVWLWFAYFTVSAVPLSYILSFKDTKFYFIIGAIYLVSDYIFMLYFIDKVKVEASLFWIILALIQMTSSIPIYFWRMNYLCKKSERQLRLAQ